MPKPPPMLRIRIGADACSARRSASSTVFCCASAMASARRFCAPLKIWKPSKSSFNLPRRSSIAGTRSASTPNCLGPPPIFMPELFSSKSGFTRTATRGRTPLHLALGFEIDHDARGNCVLEVDVRLAGAGKADARRGHAGAQGHLQLSSGRHVEAIDQPGQMPYDLGHRICLDRVVQVNPRRQVLAQKLDSLADQLAIIGIER